MSIVDCKWDKISTNQNLAKYYEKEAYLDQYSSSYGLFSDRDWFLQKYLKEQVADLF